MSAAGQGEKLMFSVFKLVLKNSRSVAVSVPAGEGDFLTNYRCTLLRYCTLASLHNALPLCYHALKFLNTKLSLPGLAGV